MARSGGCKASRCGVLDRRRAKHCHRPSSLHRSLFARHLRTGATGRRILDKSDAQTLAGARETRPTWPASRGRRSDDTRPLYDRIQDVIALYPERKSAVVPALRLAQDEYGWLSEQAFDEVADATGFTAAFCKSVASFYDMFRLTPTGRSEICVCTNVSCALVGAAGTMRAFEREVGIHPGQTTEDGL